MPFDDACRAVVDYLSEAIPMGFWMVSRREGDRHVFLKAAGTTYPLVEGGEGVWSDGFCTLMVDGLPHVNPDVRAVPAYAAAPIMRALEVGSYIGMPINRSNGELFGTICGIDPRVQDGHLAESESLLTLLAHLLGVVLEADLALTEQARLTERAQAEAETDPLTELYNRRGWDRLLVAEEARYRRFADPASIVVIDLDQLKTVNDEHGHAAGDELLALTAAMLKGCVREGDLVARLGGDEFGVLAGRSTPEQTEALVVRLKEAFAAVGVRGSFGQAPYTADGGLLGAWRRADEAMYAEKTRHRAATRTRHVA